MFKWIRSRWLVAATAVVLVAFTAGLAFGLSGADRTVAQEGSTDLPYPELVATPDGPVPTVDRTKRPLIFEREPSNDYVEWMGTMSVEQTEADSTTSDGGSSTKSVTVNYLYLRDIDRYYILPDDVKFDKMIDFGTCVPLTPEELPCPVFPLLFYQRGEARIAIDQVGQIFEDIEGGDASAFPFFTSEEDQEEGQ